MRQRHFARSVVVTFSLAELAACTGASEDLSKTVNPPPPQVDDGTPEADGGAPPADGGAAPADGGDERPIIANPPEPRPEPEPRPPTEITSRSTIEHLDDGTCIEHLSVDCPPGMACNPPPPREVPCPEPARPDATVVDNVHKRPDGSCWESYEVECPPGARCNPPAPRRVNCPPDVE
ncbi:MAG: hypothetical protein H6712_19785 [Myxococcales bacterium]|nr:hypothetical protein [Myxococcales bacterium]MCB9716117.1 hypothetical protein [Myxococcales bacterium]